MSSVGEFYVIASENMRPVEAVGPFQDREVANEVITIMKATHLRYPLTIAMRRPRGIPIMPAAMFVVELEAAMAKAAKRECVLRGEE